jgi:hypothetical protein
MLFLPRFLVVFLYPLFPLFVLSGQQLCLLSVKPAIQFSFLAMKPV